MKALAQLVTGYRRGIVQSRTKHPFTALPDTCLPDHGGDIAAFHITEAEREPFFNAQGELVFGDRGETYGRVKRDQVKG